MKKLSTSPALQAQKTVSLQGNESGFILIFSMVMLIVITLLGLWALNTATVEVVISGHEQEYEKSFQISEGGNNSESGKIGYSKTNWYAVSNPNKLNQLLFPSVASNTFDPGADIPAATKPTSMNDVIASDYRKWPVENLIGNYTPGDTEMDYSYLVTYLYPDTTPKGYDATKFAGYKFRINTHRTSDIEEGGIKVGPKSLM